MKTTAERMLSYGHMHLFMVSKHGLQLVPIRGLFLVRDVCTQL